MNIQKIIPTVLISFILNIYILFVLIPLSSFAQPDDYQPIWHCTGAESNSEFGRYLVSAGDQNMDGYDDILIANWGTREVYLYYGGSTGQMDTIPDMIFTEPYEFGYGSLPMECRDLNGDSYPDFCISADFGSQDNSKTYIYFGGPLLDNQADLVLEPDTLYTSSFTSFGLTSSMGDFNGDGIFDLAVSARNHDLTDSPRGKMYVYYGGSDMDSIPDFSITANPNEINSFSDYISCSGDLNNDGCDDIVARGWHGPYPQFRDGRMAFFGGAEPDTIPDWEFRTNGILGNGSFITPDVNDDGNDEIVVRADEYNSCDAYLFYGSEEVDTLYDVHLAGDGNSSSGCAYAGDVNNDGWGDVMLNDWAGGKINVFFLHPGMGSEKEYDLLLEFPVVVGGNGRMGYAGDVNGDGVDDFMFSSYYGEYPLYDEVFIYSNPDLSGVKQFKTQNSKFKILSAYPNPFNSSTAISYQLQADRYVKLAVYDVIGREVAVLLGCQQAAGSYQLNWDGNDFNGVPLPSGIYIVQMKCGAVSESRKLILLK
ncbi:MAG: FG-GAP repeat protein [candidate division Zixibacteria bacterium]|nr:FG-GAP repeat protein [Candidatus Tariuqbacter arcticus]